jgi:hypothetical protein
MIACMSSSCDLPRRVPDRRQMISADPGSALGKPVYHNPDSVATVLGASEAVHHCLNHLRRADERADLRPASVDGSGRFLPWADGRGKVFIEKLR